MARPAVRSYADLASMPAAGPSSPNGSVAFSEADGQFAERVDGVWTLLPNPNTPGSVDGNYVANVVADQPVGGIPVVFPVQVADGPTRDIDIVLDHKTRVTDVHLVKQGGTGGMMDTLQVKNGAAAISDTMYLSGPVGYLNRAQSISDVSWEIPAGGTLRISVYKDAADNVACTVFVHGYRVA